MAANSRVDYTVNLRDEVSGKLDQIISKMGKTDQASQNMGNTMQKVGVGIASFFAVERIKSFASEVVSVGSKYEMLQLQLNNLTGSAQAGQAVFQQLRKDALTSPFGVEELVQANAMMISSGLSAKDARTDILALSNAIAYAGKGNEEFTRMAANMQQIKNTGKATAVDIKQFGFAGINIYAALAKATGKSTAEVKDMEVSYETLAFALREASKEGGAFYGGLESIADSTAIKVSNLGDAYKEFANDLFTVGKPAVDAMIVAMGNLIEKLKDSVRWIRDNQDGIKAWSGFMYDLGVAIAFALVPYGLWLTYTKGVAIYTAIATAVSLGYNTVLWSLVGTFDLATVAAIGFWGAATLGLSFVVVALVAAYKHFEGFRAGIWGLWEAAKQVFTNIGNFFSKIFDPIFEAIDNFKSGKYLEAGKNVAELAFNISPAGLAYNASQFNFGKDVGLAFEAGQGMSRQEDYLKNRKEEKAADAAKALSDKEKALMNQGSLEGGIDNKSNLPSSPLSEGKGKGASTSSGSRSEVKQINITIGSLVKDLVISVNETRQVVPKIKEEVQKALVALVNDINVIAQ